MLFKYVKRLAERHTIAVFVADGVYARFGGLLVVGDIAVQLLEECRPRLVGKSELSVPLQHQPHLCGGDTDFVVVVYRVVVHPTRREDVLSDGYRIVALEGKRHILLVLPPENARIKVEEHIIAEVALVHERAVFLVHFRDRGFHFLAGHTEVFHKAVQVYRVVDPVTRYIARLPVVLLFGSVRFIQLIDFFGVFQIRHYVFKSAELPLPQVGELVVEVGVAVGKRAVGVCRLEGLRHIVVGIVHQWVVGHFHVGVNDILCGLLRREQVRVVVVVHALVALYGIQLGPVARLVKLYFAGALPNAAVDADNIGDCTTKSVLIVVIRVHSVSLLTEAERPYTRELTESRHIGAYAPPAGVFNVVAQYQRFPVVLVPQRVDIVFPQLRGSVRLYRRAVEGLFRFGELRPLHTGRFLRRLPRRGMLARFVCGLVRPYPVLNAQDPEQIACPDCEQHGGGSE